MSDGRSNGVSNPYDLGPEEMEEPVPCPDCGDWHELQDARTCRRCNRLVCPECINAGTCYMCRENSEGYE